MNVKKTFRIPRLALLSVLSAWIASCSMTASVEGVDTVVGSVRRANINVEIDANQSGKGQFLDADQEPIGPMFDVPTGTSVQLIPPGAVYIQFTDGNGARATLKSYWFYSIPPDNGALPSSSNIDYALSVFSKVNADTSLGNGWSMSRLTFKGLGTSVAPQGGTTVEAFVKFEGDRSFQGSGPGSAFPVRAIVADDEQITDFQIYFNDVLVADQNTSTADSSSGSWGAWANAWSLVRPHRSWLGGASMRADYTLASGHQISVSLNLGM